MNRDCIGKRGFEYVRLISEKPAQWPALPIIGDRKLQVPIGVALRLECFQAESDLAGTGDRRTITLKQKKCLEKWMSLNLPLGLQCLDKLLEWQVTVLKCRQCSGAFTVQYVTK